MNVRREEISSPALFFFFKLKTWWYPDLTDGISMHSVAPASSQLHFSSLPHVLNYKVALTRAAK